MSLYAHCPISPGGNLGSGQSGGGIIGGNPFKGEPLLMKELFATEEFIAADREMCGIPACLILDPSAGPLTERSVATGLFGLRIGTAGGPIVFPADPLSTGEVSEVTVASRLESEISFCVSESDALPALAPGGASGGKIVGGGDSGRADANKTDDRRDELPGRSIEETDDLTPWCPAVGVTLRLVVRDILRWCCRIAWRSDAIASEILFASEVRDLCNPFFKMEDDAGIGLEAERMEGGRDEAVGAMLGVESPSMPFVALLISNFPDKAASVFKSLEAVLPWVALFSERLDSAATAAWIAIIACFWFAAVASPDTLIRDPTLRTLVTVWLAVEPRLDDKKGAGSVLICTLAGLRSLPMGCWEAPFPVVVDDGEVDVEVCVWESAEFESLDPAPMRVPVAGLDDLEKELLLRLEFRLRGAAEFKFIWDGATTKDSREWWMVREGGRAGRSAGRGIDGTSGIAAVIGTTLALLVARVADCLPIKVSKPNCPSWACCSFIRDRRRVISASICCKRAATSMADISVFSLSLPGARSLAVVELLLLGGADPVSVIWALNWAGVERTDGLGCSGSLYVLADICCFVKSFSWNLGLGAAPATDGRTGIGTGLKYDLLLPAAPISPLTGIPGPMVDMGRFIGGNLSFIEPALLKLLVSPMAIMEGGILGDLGDAGTSTSMARANRGVSCASCATRPLLGKTAMLIRFADAAAALLAEAESNGIGGAVIEERLIGCGALLRRAARLEVCSRGWASLTGDWDCVIATGMLAALRLGWGKECNDVNRGESVAIMASVGSEMGNSLCAESGEDGESQGEVAAVMTVLSPSEVLEVRIDALEYLDVSLSGSSRKDSGERDEFVVDEDVVDVPVELVLRTFMSFKRFVLTVMGAPGPLDIGPKYPVAFA
jgi:hypothetical protein